MYKRQPEDGAASGDASPAGRATVGIVLAAGEGSRWDGPGHKLLAPLSDGRPVIVHAVEAAVESGIGPVAVVWGAVSVADALAGLNITLVEHPGWAAGQATCPANSVRPPRLMSGPCPPRRGPP